MNRDIVVGICSQFKGHLTEHWGRVSGDPMTAAVGRRDRLSGQIQQQRGIVKEATERELKEFLARNRNWRHLSSR